MLDKDGLLPLQAFMFVLTCNQEVDDRMLPRLESSHVLGFVLGRFGARLVLACFQQSQGHRTL